ncbi:MAG: glycyl-tRNA synthetase subunit beta [Sulfuricurvum sp. PC08-66]|nr:MAG: glycyl-tRNA synthetase subunit beta [Sulfuricurvum sp. PC08-66]
MLQSLLVEIGVEELPAIPFLKELPNIEAKWLKILEEARLQGDFEFYYTPRRLVLWHREFLTQQPDATEEFFGAPLSVAYKDGEPTQAALGFAKKCGVDISHVSSTTKEGKEVLYFSKTVAGRPSKELLASMLKAFIESLNFGKSMRWASNSEQFIRPIRWLSVILGHEVVPCELFGVTSQAFTYAHRQHSFEPLSFNGPKAYFEVLEGGKVSLFSQQRREKILQDFAQLEKMHGVKIEIDKGLLDEVVAITEHPTAVMGSFDATFLTLPSEVIVTSMREHQRYFPVYANGALTHHFVVVSNALATDFGQIVAGNERVLRARLSDALFFYQNDLSRGLQSKGLDRVVYMNGLGSLADKVEREKAIATLLLEYHATFFTQGLALTHAQILALVERFFTINKADLLTEMVYEFTELQGIMGSYYAKAQGEHPLIVTAMNEQYLPNGEASALPSTLFGALVAMSVKTESIMGLFSIEQIPTGSRDPFALRRAANGLLQIALTFKIPLSIDTLLGSADAIFGNFDTKALRLFIFDRLYSLYAVNPSIIKAVLASGESDIVVIDQKISALNTLVATEDFREFVSLFKRVANISEDAPRNLTIDTNAFIEPIEHELYKAFAQIETQSYATISDKLDALYGLRSLLGRYFENVMVNAQDETLRNARKGLIGAIYGAFRDIADIKEIAL